MRLSAACQLGAARNRAARETVNQRGGWETVTWGWRRGVTARRCGGGGKLLEGGAGFEWVCHASRPAGHPATAIAHILLKTNCRTFQKGEGSLVHAMRRVLPVPGTVRRMSLTDMGNT